MEKEFKEYHGCLPEDERFVEGDGEVNTSDIITHRRKGRKE